MNVVIVDDEHDALVTIEQFILKFSKEITTITKANSVQSAVETINKQQPAIVFLDINMQDGTGFDVLEKVEFKNFKTIFTTAYDEYAIKAFKVKAFQYLLKPINPLELQAAIRDAVSEIDSNKELEELQETLTNFKVEKVGLPVKDKIELTKLDDILRLEAEANYTKVFLTNESSILVAKTLKVFETLLSEKPFIRIHQSHMVNINYVVSFNQKESELTLSNDVIVPVSRRHKTMLAKIIGMKII